MHFSQLATITSGKVIQHPFEEMEALYLLTDSRKPSPSQGAVFFAIRGDHHNGHHHVMEAYSKGVRQFIVDQEVDLPKDANVLKVKNTLTALQQIAIAHREKFNLNVIGITGSNGKTIVKEWLGELLSGEKHVVKNPASYNSQLGVPVSVWQIRKGHDVGLFEAGISKPGEMQKLERIIQPNIGVFTNLGPAHDDGFESREQKLEEKLQLFKNCAVVVSRYNKDLAEKFGKRLFCWGSTSDCNVQIARHEANEGNTPVQLTYKGVEMNFNFPFSDEMSYENMMNAICTALYLGLNPMQIKKGIKRIRPVKMRLELKQGLHGVIIIDDSYSNDLASFKSALNFLIAQGKGKDRVLILSDIMESGLPEKKRYAELSKLLEAVSPKKVFIVGSPEGVLKVSEAGIQYFKSTEDLVNSEQLATLHDCFVLIKGGRKFGLERVSAKLEEKAHGTRLEIDLNAITYNLNVYRSKLKPHTKMMVMVKALAYGSGIEEVARLLSFHKVDYLGVAYADEGVHLREEGIEVPIMVLNPSADSFQKIVHHNLEPELYNLEILKHYIAFLKGAPGRIHLKIETGMNRLGFSMHELNEVVNILNKNKNVEVVGCLSHLAAADDPAHNEFTHNQAETFEKAADFITKALGYRPLCHLLNSAGIISFPEYQFDMVRLGIGLYGVEVSGNLQEELKPIGRLKTIISQISLVQPGETVGYGRAGKVKKESKVATLAIGYADGFGRVFSNGVGEVYLNGRRAPVIGNVCMDMTMIDITGVPAKVGDEVEIFGDHITLQEVAQRAKTIPYEILTNVSGRVKRVYFAE